MINFKRRFHGNSTSIQFYTVPNLNLQDLSYHMVYHLFEGEGGDTSSKFAPSGSPTIEGEMERERKRIRERESERGRVERER